MPYLTQSRNQSPLQNPFAEVDGLFRQFFGPQGTGTRSFGNPQGGWNAPASLHESDTHLIVQVEAPGVSSENVDITVENQQLSIELKRPLSTKSPVYLYNERRFGSVTRSLGLPDSVDPNSVEASLKDGVLTVAIAKRPERQPRKVEIRQG